MIVTFSSCFEFVSERETLGDASLNPMFPSDIVLEAEVANVSPGELERFMGAPSVEMCRESASEQDSTHTPLKVW
jgi:hypothetical protein